MFCPLCKTEYQEGFYTCADCSVPLVTELPQRNEDQVDTGEFIEVFETLDQSEILLIKSVLDEERIPYHFPGDFFRMSAILISPARLLVPNDAKDRVIEILRELQMA